MKNRRVFTGCFFPFILAIAIQYGVVFMASWVISFKQAFELAAKGITDYDQMMEEMVGAFSNPDLILLISMIGALACLIVYAIWYKKENVPKSYQVTVKVLNIRRVVSIVLLAAGIQFGTTMILQTLYMLKPEWFEYYQQLMKSLGDGNSILSILYIGLIAPISEELIYRGVIFHRCKRFAPFMTANIIQAVLFGVNHMNLIQGIYAFLFGLVLGFVCYRYESILPSILLHMLINIFGIILDNVLTEQMLQTPIFMSVVFVVAFCAVAFGIKLVLEEKKPDARNEVMES